MRFNRELSRRVDQIAIEQFGMSGLVLMENAGRNAAEVLAEQFVDSPSQTPLAIVCGKGNNAGDGLVIARHLHNRGCPIELFLVESPEHFSGDAAANWKIVAAMQLPYRVIGAGCPLSECQQQWSQSVWLVDALLGTGLQGEVREPYASVIEAINGIAAPSSGPRVCALDLPSGLDCDTGAVLGAAIRADLTTTFVTEKLGFHRAAGPEHVGHIAVIDIGVPRAVIDQVAARCESDQ